MRFEKWQALGNDYLIIEREQLPFQLTAARIVRICDPHFGVGSDGILLLDRSEDDAVARLQIYNPDGSRAELSGNGAREAILYLRQRGWTTEQEFEIATDAGRVRPEITGADTCRVHMGRASLQSKDYPGGPADGAGEIEAGGRRIRFRHISIGNPQCAIAASDLATLEQLDLKALGPSIEANTIFPNRTNVSWYAEMTPPGAGAPAEIRARIFERGVGETLSSGTGASGAAIAYLLGTGALQREGSSEAGRHAAASGLGTPEGGAAVRVHLDGGQLLVEVGADLSVHLTGWGRPVFAGRLSDEFLKELNETK